VLSVDLEQCTVTPFNVQGRILAMDGSCIRCATLTGSGAFDVAKWCASAGDTT
jgi:hypothetical protein